jgi:predicted SPOUT superfamily RNA methylase MTH1
VLSVEQDLRDKTYKAGLISRALAIFRVDEVRIFLDEESTRDDQEMLLELLNYQVVPPHLKKQVVGLSEKLKYAGIMPPLNLPNHLPPRNLNEGDLIDVLITTRKGSQCSVYMGEAGEGLLKPCHFNVNDIVAARVIRRSGRQFELEPSSWGNIYTGYKVLRSGKLLAELQELKEQGVALVGTSKYGTTDYWLLRGLLGRPIALIVGGPKSGLLQYTSRKAFDLLINAAPLQGTETLRSEEALLASLTLLNTILTD